METTAFTSRVKTTSLVLLTTAFAAVCNAAFTNPDGLWLIADDIGSAGAVSSWNHNAGGGAALTLTQATPANQPTAVASALNGHMVVSFDGGDYVAANTVGSSILAADESTTLLVLSSGSASQSASWFGWVKSGTTADNLSNAFQTSQTPGQLNLGQGNFNVGGASVSASQPAGFNTGYHVVSLIRHTDGTGSIRVDGQALTTSPTFTTSLTPSDAGAVAVGGLFGGDLFTGSIAEIMLYKSGSVDVSAAESALFTKYGLTPVPEPSQYAAIFGVACLLGGVAYRMRRQAKSAA